MSSSGRIAVYLVGVGLALSVAAFAPNAFASGIGAGTGVGGAGIKGGASTSSLPSTRAYEANTAHYPVRAAPGLQSKAQGGAANANGKPGPRRARRKAVRAGAARTSRAQ